MDKPSKIFSASDEFERIYVKPKEGRTLIVGSYVTKDKADRRKLYEDVVGVDMRIGPGVDWVVDMEEGERIHADPLFDHVECVSVLEHSRRPWLLAANVERLMNSGSTLHFSIPFVWRIHAHPSDYWRMTVEAVRELFQNIEWKMLLYGDEVGFREAGSKVRATRVDGHLYLARCQVFGFGVKR